MKQMFLTMCLFVGMSASATAQVTFEMALQEDQQASLGLVVATSEYYIAKDVAAPNIELCRKNLEAEAAAAAEYKLAIEELEKPCAVAAQCYQQYCQPCYQQCYGGGQCYAGGGGRGGFFQNLLGLALTGAQIYGMVQTGGASAVATSSITNIIGGGFGRPSVGFNSGGIHRGGFGR